MLELLLTTEIYSIMATAIKPIIKPIPPNVHEYLFKQQPAKMPESLVYKARYELEQYNLDIVDESKWFDLPIPELDVPLPQWVEREVKKQYKPYEDLANAAMKIKAGNPPPLSPYRNWSMYDEVEKRWIKIKAPDTKILFFDFEAIKMDAKKYQWRCFICAGIGENGEWYSWIAPDFEKLPKVVDFGDTMKLGIGHNMVAYDRRYVKQSYDYLSDVRYLDTLALYYFCMGMSDDQNKQYRKHKAAHTRLPWMNKTCEGGLGHLAFFFGIELQKQTRKEIEGYQASDLDQHLRKIWKYCCMDTYATQVIYTKLYPKWRNMAPHIISFAGQIERSCLRVKVDPNLDEKLKRVDAEVKKLLAKRNTWLTTILKNVTWENASPPLQNLIECWIKKDYWDRVSKSKPFERWAQARGYTPSTHPIHTEVLSVYLKVNDPTPKEGTDDPREVVEEVDTATSTITAQNLKDSINQIDARSIGVIRRLSCAVEYLETNETRISPKDIDKWKADQYKEADESSDKPYLSVMGKVAPLLVDLHWLGYRMVHNGITWGIWVDGKFEKLPHPDGGNDNVGTPLSKSFRALAVCNEFDSGAVIEQYRACDIATRKEIIQPLHLDINLLFDNISEVALWEMFRKRWRCIYVHNDIWLPEGLPCGTVSERMTSKLKDVMANTDEKEPEKNRAGSEMKMWLMPEFNRLGMDYPSQESKIFVAHQDAISGFCGTSAYSCQVHAGSSERKTDIHTLSSIIFGIKRSTAKNCNFANQFMAGVKRLATMIYRGSGGKKTLEECYEIAKKFIELSRGKKDEDYKSATYMQYVGGMASEAFNKILRLLKQNDQKTEYLKRQIPDPLNKRWLAKNGDELTTRFNYPIQSVGQELINTCMCVMRVLATKHNVPLQLMFMIHDELCYDVPDEHVHDVAWMLQISHFFSKALMYNAFGVKIMPMNDAFSEGIDFDPYALRKTPTDPCTTPSHDACLLPGKILKVEECYPKTITKF